VPSPKRDENSKAKKIEERDVEKTGEERGTTEKRRS